MFLKIFVIIIYCCLIKLFFDGIMLIYKILIKKDKKKVTMHKFQCPYCIRNNELLVTKESTFFMTKFLPIGPFIITLYILTILIPFRDVFFIRKILLYVFFIIAVIGLIFGGVAFLANIIFKKKNENSQNGFILKVADIVFNVRKARCTYCKKESCKITGY